MELRGGNVNKTTEIYTLVDKGSRRCVCARVCQQGERVFKGG